MRRLLLIMLLSSGCTPDGNTETPRETHNIADAGNDSREIASIVIEPRRPALWVDTTLALEATAFDAEGREVASSFDWSSADAMVAEVASSGTVIGTGVGVTVVTAAAGDVTEGVEVTVAPTPAAELILSKTEFDLVAGDTERLIVELVDANGGLIDVTAREITFATSDENVATVTPQGVIMAIAQGEASIVVTAEDLEATVTVNVRAAEPEGLLVTPSVLRVYPGDTAQLEARVVGDEDSESVEWRSSNVVTATVSADGLVTALNKGRATITASAAGFSATVDVEVAFDFSEVSAGGAHACALLDGAAWCWGDNTFGQLGHADSQPAPVDTTLRFRDVAAGGHHTCGITMANELFCWGRNESGQLGDGTYRSTPTPVAAGNLSFANVSAGSEHTCAITTNDEAYCWGNGDEGRLGNGSTAGANVPVFVGNYTGVSAGDRHTCATKGGVSLDCWGENDDGQLGRNFSSDFEPTPGQISGGYDFGSIAVGGAHACGVTVVGTSACWGLNASGQVGDGTTTTRQSPILLPSFTPLSRLTSGGAHSCGLSATGEAYCWGESDDARLGTGATSDELGPKAVIGGLQFSQISGGSNFTCAVTTIGDLYCWGAGYGPEPSSLF